MIKTLKQSVQTSVVGSHRGDSTILICSFANAIDAKSVRIKLGPGESIIDWGDGCVESFNIGLFNNDINHSYSDSFIEDHTDKTFNVIVDGNIYLILSNQESGASNSGLRSLIVNVMPLSHKQSSACNLFQFCTNLKSIPSDLFNYCEIENFMMCFLGSGIEYIPKTLFDNADKESNFYSAFENCQSLKVSDLEFNSKVASTFSIFHSMFKDCNSLETISPGTFKNVNVKSDFKYCFDRCSELKIPDHLLDSCYKSEVRYMFSNLISESNSKDIPTDLFSKFDENVLSSSDEAFRPFAITDEDESHKMRKALFHSKIKLNVGKTQVNLYDLV